MRASMLSCKGKPMRRIAAVCIIIAVVCTSMLLVGWRFWKPKLKVSKPKPPSVEIVEPSLNISGPSVNIDPTGIGVREPDVGITEPDVVIHEPTYPGAGVAGPSVSTDMDAIDEFRVDGEDNFVDEP